MYTAPLSRVIEVDWLAASPIGPHAVAFKRHLTERRYAAHTIASYVAHLEHFARWVCTRRLPLGSTKSRLLYSLTTTCRVALALGIRGTTVPITARRLGTCSSCFVRKVPLRSRLSALGR
jgi:hypothetical protein